MHALADIKDGFRAKYSKFIADGITNELANYILSLYFLKSVDI